VEVGGHGGVGEEGGYVGLACGGHCYDEGF